MFTIELLSGKPVNKSSVKEYMNQKISETETLQDFLIRGLSELAKTKPGSNTEVITWFGTWLLKNNPSQPTINES